MKNWILYSVIGLIGCLGFAQELTPNEQKKWTLEACITHAIENNISVKQADIDVEAVDIDKKAALGRFLPSINANANSSWNVGLTDDPTTGQKVNQTSNTVSAGLSSGLSLYNGLQNQKRLQRVKLSKVATEFQREQIQQNTAVMVANAFLQIISNKENVKIQKEQLANNELRLQRTQELVDGGQLPKGEALNIQADIYSNKQQLIFAETELYLSKINLAQLLVLENPMEFDIDDTTISIEPSDILMQKPQDIVAKALNERVEVKLAQSRVNLARKDIDIAKGARSPSLSAFYNFGTNYNDFERLTAAGLKPADPFVDQLWNNRGHSFGLSLNVPVFNGFSVKTGIERAQVAFEKAKLTADQARLDLENDVYTAYAATERALNSYLAAQETVKARAEAFRYTQERNAVGMSNSYDVSQSQVLLTTAQSEMNKAKYDYLFRVKILELYFGVKLF
ncbi:MAG: TolC family protein [Flavobacteriales bacterium]|nr:TolC family protein [Flavobacteriales bacterium]